MIRLKIDLLKLAGAKTFTAKDGTECIAFNIEANNFYVGKKSISMDVTLMDNRGGPDQYGNDGFAVIDIGKERRLAGEKGPIVGNWKDLDGGQPSGTRNQYGGTDRTAQEARRQPAGTTQPDDDCDDVPF